MKTRKFFPAVKMEKHGRGFEGLVGLKLKSILQGDLLLQSSHFKGGKSDQATRFDPQYFFSAREAFLQSISTLLMDVTLELHISALPNLADRSDGLLWHTLFLRCRAADAEKVKERLVSRYLSLVPVLTAHLPESEYEPIVDANELEFRFRPFKPLSAAALKRCNETISLLEPLKRLSLGFGPIEVKTDDYPHSVNHRFPWFPSLNDGSKLINTLMAQFNPVQIVVRIESTRLNSKSIVGLDQTIRACESFLSGSKKTENSLMDQASSIRDVSLQQFARLRNHCFRVAVLLTAPGKIDRSLGNVLGAAVTGSSFGAEKPNFFRGGFGLFDVNPGSVLKRSYFPEKEPFTLAEAACAFCFPTPPIDECPGLPVKRSRTSLAWVRQDGRSGNGKIDLFLNDHQGVVKRVSMGPEDRMRHMFIIGQTGTGKSTYMENMIVQDIRNNMGLAVVDPHGDLVEDVLGKIPKRRLDDVIVFDLLDRERPLGFNILQWETIEERDLMIDELYLTIDHMYDMRSTGGPIFEEYFRGALKLLMGDKPRQGFVPTLLDFVTCFLSKDFRKWLSQSITDPQVKDFIQQIERAGGDARLDNVTPYINSKLNRFVNDTTLQLIIGQEKTAFDFENIMNSGKILLVKLGKGRFGPVTSALITNQLVSRFKLAAMKRGEMEYDQRRHFMLYVDEAGNLPSENFMELLAEARKYRLGLVLATQYTGQLSQAGFGHQDNLLSAIFGNVGTIVAFRVGQEDAPKIAPILEPQFSALDVIGLPNWQGYVKMQMNNETIPPFSFKTIKDETPFDRGIASKIKTASRMKYGADCKTVREQIHYRRDIWKE